MKINKRIAKPILNGSGKSFIRYCYPKDVQSDNLFGRKDYVREPEAGEVMLSLDDLKDLEVKISGIVDDTTQTPAEVTIVSEIIFACTFANYTQVPLSEKFISDVLAFHNKWKDRTMMLKELLNESLKYSSDTHPCVLNAFEEACELGFPRPSIYYTLLRYYSEKRDFDKARHILELGQKNAKLSCSGLAPYVSYDILFEKKDMPFQLEARCSNFENNSGIGDKLNQYIRNLPEYQFWTNCDAALLSLLDQNFYKALKINIEVDESVKTAKLLSEFGRDMEAIKAYEHLVSEGVATPSNYYSMFRLYLNHTESPEFLKPFMRETYEKFNNIRTTNYNNIMSLAQKYNVENLVTEHLKSDGVVRYYYALYDIYNEYKTIDRFGDLLDYGQVRNFNRLNLLNSL